MQQVGGGYNEGVQEGGEGEGKGDSDFDPEAEEVLKTIASVQNTGGNPDNTDKNASLSVDTSDVPKSQDGSSIFKIANDEKFQEGGESDDTQVKSVSFA